MLCHRFKVEHQVLLVKPQSDVGGVGRTESVVGSTGSSSTFPVDCSFRSVSVATFFLAPSAAFDPSATFAFLSRFATGFPEGFFEGFFLGFFGDTFGLGLLEERFHFVLSWDLVLRLEGLTGGVLDLRGCLEGLPGGVFVDDFLALPVSAAVTADAACARAPRPPRMEESAIGVPVVMIDQE